MIKNEIGDVAVDTALAESEEMTASKELLGDCICCTNVGQIEDALATLDRECHPDRIIIETSGSAEPLKLVLEINRLSEATGRYSLDGVISVIDAENWGGYANTSYTAKLQAKQTDLIVINKWESLCERDFDLFLDRLGDLDVDTPQTKSDFGQMSVDLMFGFDTKLARAWMVNNEHDHAHDHRSEMECISVTFRSTGEDDSLDLNKLEELLVSAPKDEIYRIKAIAYSREPPDGVAVPRCNSVKETRSRYILNWAFDRSSYIFDEADDPGAPTLRMSLFTAPYESEKWMKRIEFGSFIALSDGSGDGQLEIKRVQ